MFGFQSDHILTEFSSDMVANGEYLHVHVCVILYTWRPGELENTRWNIHKRHTSMSQLKLSPVFWIVVLRRERYQIKDSVRLDVEALNEDLCPAACPSLCGQPSLFGDDTQAVFTRPKCGWKAWHTDRCSTQGRGQA